MKTKNTLIIILIIMLILTSCRKESMKPASTDISITSNINSNSDQNMTPNIIHYKDNKIEHGEFEELQELEPYKYPKEINNYTEDYNISKSLEDPLYNFSDAIFVDDKIIATDKRGSQLVILDSNLVVEGSIGTLGSGNLEFMNPVAIDKDRNGNVYILDSGNSRIQVLDSEFQYIKEIKLDFLEGFDLRPREVGFIVDQDGKYAYFTDTFIAMLLCIDLNNGMIYKLDDYTAGKLTKDEENVYYVSRSHYIINGNDREIYTKYIYLYKIKENIIHEKIRLYDNLYPSGITVIEDSLYYMNGYQLFMIEYDLNGNYISSPYSGVVGDKKNMPKEVIEGSDKYYEIVFKKLYYTTCNMKQGRGNDILVVYNNVSIGEDSRGGSLAILSNNQ